MKSFVVTLEFGQLLQNSSGQNQKQPGARLISVPYEGETMQASVRFHLHPPGLKPLEEELMEQAPRSGICWQSHSCLSTKFASALRLSLRAPFVPSALQLH